MAPRKTFLTEWRDAQGNSVTLEYDTNQSFLRVTKIVDAIGQVTDLFYEHPDPYKITKVEDPFGRSTTPTVSSSRSRTSSTGAIPGVVSHWC